MLILFCYCCCFLFVYLADEVVFAFVSVVFSREMIKDSSRPPALNAEVVFFGITGFPPLKGG